MRLQRGTLKKLEAITGIVNTRLSDYAATRVRPRPEKAMLLEKACKQLGYNCPAIMWLCGSSQEIKSRFLNAGK